MKKSFPLRWRRRWVVFILYLRRSAQSRCSIDILSCPLRTVLMETLSFNPWDANDFNLFIFAWAVRYYTLHGLKTDYHGVDGFVLTCQGSDNVYIHSIQYSTLFVNVLKCCWEMTDWGWWFFVSFISKQWIYPLFFTLENLWHIDTDHSLYFLIEGGRLLY